MSDGDPAQQLDLYLPDPPSEKPLPLVVWIHGGAWKGGSKSGCPALGMVRKGYAAASVEYRFSQKALFPAQIQDCQAAIRFKFNTPSDPYSGLIGVNLGENKQKSDAVSPVHYVSSDNPPFLILHGTKDALVPFAQSEELAAALEGKGVKVLFQKIPGGGHGGPGFNKPAVNELIQKFFDKYLKGEDIQVGLVPEADVTVPGEPGKAK